MRILNKTLSVIIIVFLIGSSLIFLNSISANTIPQPAIPDFSLRFVDSSYDVPTTHVIDPYTGQDITHQGYHVSKTNLIMTIQNQPSVYQYGESFLYNIRVKGHYEENWTQLYLNDQIPLANSSSTQTILIMGTLYENGLTLTGSSTAIPYGGMEDFQIQAMIGGFFKTGFDHTEFSGESSDWSSTQTVTIGEATQTASPTPSQSSISPSINPTGNQVFGLDWVGIAVVVLLVVIVVLLVFVVFYLRRRSNSARSTA